VTRLSVVGIVAAAVLLSAQASCKNQVPSANRPTASSPTKEPVGVFIMSGNAVKQVFQQCSRGAPKAGESTWQPELADITTLEGKLSAALIAHGNSDGVDFRQAPLGWWRQYVGIIRGGKRYIYGNFFRPYDPPPAGPRIDWHREAAVICDGGPQFFGIEFDPTTKTFTQIDFNGAV
jgi:hypothetical protein